MSDLVYCVEGALIAQKNHLLGKVDTAKDGVELREAKKLLDFAAILWRQIEYGYKVKEINSRILEKAINMIEAEEEYLSTCRKNDRTRASTENEIKRLKEIVRLCKETYGNESSS
jgi:hypothetical protein